MVSLFGGVRRQAALTSVPRRRIELETNVRTIPRGNALLVDQAKIFFVSGAVQNDPTGISAGRVAVMDKVRPAGRVLYNVWLYQRPQRSRTRQHSGRCGIVTPAAVCCSKPDREPNAGQGNIRVVGHVGDVVPNSSNPVHNLFKPGLIFFRFGLNFLFWTSQLIFASCRCTCFRLNWYGEF